MPKQKHAGGRPLIFKSPEELETKIQAYFDMCEEKNKPLTYAGLAFGLGIDRQTLYNYAERDKFFDSIKKARDRVTAYIEEWAMEKGNAGTIFLMKNYGYTDRQEVDTTIKGNFSDALGKFVDKIE